MTVLSTKAHTTSDISLEDLGGEEVCSEPQGDAPLKSVGRPAPHSGPHFLADNILQECEEDEEVEAVEAPNKEEAPARHDAHGRCGAGPPKLTGNAAWLFPATDQPAAKKEICKATDTQPKAAAPTRRVPHGAGCPGTSTSTFGPSWPGWHDSTWCSITCRALFYICFCAEPLDLNVQYSSGRAVVHPGGYSSAYTLHSLVAPLFTSGVSALLGYVPASAPNFQQLWVPLMPGIILADTSKNAARIIIRPGLTDAGKSQMVDFVVRGELVSVNRLPKLLIKLSCKDSTEVQLE